MASARFLFHGPLSAFLKRERRGQAFAYECARAASLKNAIEALGVPHTEAGRIEVNGAPATLQRTVRDGDLIEVHPARPGSGSDPDLFLADAHLGRLARFLRMLGFDTLHDQAWRDDAIRRIAADEGRVVLTRDRELLKCRDIAHGCYVRSLEPEAQLREVAARFGLPPRARPFTLCLRCNLPLSTLEKAAVAGRVPEKVFSANDKFSACAGCGRLYWPGSHFRRMQAALDAALPSGTGPSSSP